MPFFVLHPPTAYPTEHTLHSTLEYPAAHVDLVPLTPCRHVAVGPLRHLKNANPLDSEDAQYPVWATMCCCWMTRLLGPGAVKSRGRNVAPVQSPPSGHGWHVMASLPVSLAYSDGRHVR